MIFCFILLFCSLLPGTVLTGQMVPFSLLTFIPSTLTHPSLIPFISSTCCVARDRMWWAFILWWKHQGGLINSLRNKQAAQPQRQSSQDRIPSAWENKSPSSKAGKSFYGCEIDHRHGAGAMKVVCRCVNVCNVVYAWRCLYWLYCMMRHDFFFLCFGAQTQLSFKWERKLIWIVTEINRSFDV